LPYLRKLSARGVQVMIDPCEAEGQGQR